MSALRSFRATKLPLVAAAAAMALLAACGGDDAAVTPDSTATGEDRTAERLTMNIGVQSLVLQTYYPQLAEDLGYFEDENLDVTITVGESTANSVQGLIGGSIDAYLGGPEGMAANQQGADLRFVVAASNRSIWNLVTSPEITSLDQLNGANIGVSALQSISTVTLRQALAANGVDVDTLNYIAAGGSAKRFAALLADQVQAVPLGIPVNYQASDTEGFTDFGNTNDLGAPPVAGAVVTVSKEWADEHPEEMTRFLRAYQRTVDALYNPDMTDEITAIVAEGIAVEPEYMRRAIDEIFFQADGQIMPADSHIDPEALQTAADAFLEFDAISEPMDASTMLDMSYLETAQESLESDPPPTS